MDLSEPDPPVSQAEENGFFVPPGHFFSPIPSLEHVKKNEQRIFGAFPSEIPGIDLREAEQLALLKEFEPYYDEMPFHHEKTVGLRYFF